MMRKLLLCLLLVVTPTWHALAAEASDLAQDPVVEQRLITISEELRCLVCQNESLAGSRADLANDLRREIRTLIQDGKSDPEIMEFLVSRYGDFVRYRPPVKPLTWLLWFGPVVLLLFAGFGLWRLVLSNRAQATPLEISPEQKEQARALLESDSHHP